MTTSNAMSREELLENAGLDALGLLDEYESTLYTRAFHNAPPALQEQVIQLQAQIVSDPTLLPSVTPDPELRSRVLQAVAEAIEEETGHLEPLASIGGGRNRDKADAAAMQTVASSAQYWRAAAFAMCAGLLVVLYFLAQLTQQHSEVTRLALSNLTSAELKEALGQSFTDNLLKASPKSIITFKTVPQALNPQPAATLLIVEGDSDAFLVVSNLPLSAQPYQLSVKDKSGRIETVHEFSNTGNLGAVKFALTSVQTTLTNVTWQISTPSGGVLLASI